MPVGIVKIKCDADVDNLVRQIRCAARSTLNKLTSMMGSDYMEVFHEVRFIKFGQRPLGNISPTSAEQLTLAEQFNQSSHALTTLAAAKRLLKAHLDCAGLELSLTTGGGRDITSINKGGKADLLVEAEVFATVDTDYNSKLSDEIEDLSQKSDAKHRYVFFYCPSDDHEPSERCVQKAKQAKITICRLTKTEVI